MRTRLFPMLVGGAALMFSTPVHPQQTRDAASAAASQQAVVTRYCVTCHNERAKTGGLSLENLSVSRVGERTDVWEKVVQKLHANLMPPPDRPRPDQSTLKHLLSYLETSLDRAADAKPDPGRTEALHRLNRAEYRNAVRDLLALDIDVSAMLSADDVSYGFDNIAGVQRMSPTLMERYLAAAQKISSVAVGASPRAATTETFLVPPELQQNAGVEGLPFGTRGGTMVRHTFPRDGVYSIRVQLTRYAGASFDEIPVFDEPQRLELSVDGTPVHVFELPPAAHREGRGYSGANRRGLDADWYVRFPAKAGPRDVTLTFLNRTPALLENLLEPFQRPAPGGPNGYYTTQKGAYLRSVEISGPYDATGAGHTPSRQRIFACRPSTASDESRCAKQILSSLARRAFRRPVGDADLQTVLTLYQEGRASRDFEFGIERAVEGLLVSPEFLYRVEREPAAVRRDAEAVRLRDAKAVRLKADTTEGAAPTPAVSGSSRTVSATSIYRISDLELASRLSFFLWSSIPDDALLDAAIAGKLQNHAGLEQQARRMLADSRAEALVTNFVGQWLFLRNLSTILPDPTRESDFDEDLRQGLRRETELFAGSILREDRSVLDLLTANHTFVNERLAKHYGIPHIRGPHFRRVERNDDRRRGLLGQASVLAVTSFPHRTSPVVRGKWILENLLGTPLPPPPPDVPALEEKPNPGDEEKSMRLRIAQHRASPQCASCHATMDPLGLSLENFDMVGRWRDVDEALAPIDASGTLPDGTKFDGPAGLRAVLMSDPDRFVRTVTEKLLTYALGRGLEHYDMPAVRKIVRDAAKSNYRASSLVIGVVNSRPFLMRRRQS
jgi:mono/diheme cytochrome c family protein